MTNTLALKKRRCNIMLDVFERFVERYEKAGKGATAKTYSSLLNQFSKHLDSVEDLDEESVRDYLDEKNYKKKTQDDLISCLKGFAKWYSNNEIDWDDYQKAKKVEQRMNSIMDMIRPSVPQRKHRKALRIDEVERLLEGLNDRDSTYLLLSCYFGMRYGEWSNIEQVDFENNQLRVMTGKTDVERVLPFSNKFAPVLKQFLEKGWYERSYQTYYTSLRPRSSALEGEVKVTPHSGRHTFKSEMSRRVDSGLVKNLLGHETEASDKYDDPDMKYLKEAMVDRHYLKDFKIPEKVKA